MLKRKIYDSLVAWKHRSCGKTSLLIDGARRVGKSYIAEQFAKNEYKSYIIVVLVISQKMCWQHF